MMFHTFVISAYQDSPYLESCIKSLKAQTVPSEIICTTSTPSPYLTKLMEKYQIPLYVREGRSDIQEDWNFAISKASGEFVTVAHQDDMYNRHYTEELMKQFDKWPDMTVFMTDAVTVKNGRLYHWGSKEMVKKLLVKAGQSGDVPVLRLPEELSAGSYFPFRASFCPGLGLHDRSGQMAGKIYLCGEASSVLPGT